MKVTVPVGVPAIWGATVAVNISSAAFALLLGMAAVLVVLAAVIAAEVPAVVFAV
jgi:hypothetical protein